MDWMSRTRTGRPATGRTPGAGSLLGLAVAVAAIGLAAPLAAPMVASGFLVALTLAAVLPRRRARCWPTVEGELPGIGGLGPAGPGTMAVAVGDGAPFLAASFHVPGDAGRVGSQVARANHFIRIARP